MLRGYRLRHSIGQNQALGRVFKLIGDAVFGSKAGWRDATREHTLHGSVTEKQRSQAAFHQKSYGRHVFGPMASWSSPLQPARGCSGLSALPSGQIHCRRTPSNLKTRPRKKQEKWHERLRVKKGREGSFRRQRHCFHRDAKKASKTGNPGFRPINHQLNTIDFFA